MSSFLNGPDCGPGNVLKTVGNRIDRDTSLQQDRLISTPNIAGPSRHGFNHQIPIAHPSPINGKTPATFDLTSLKAHLIPSPTAASRTARPPPSDWAADFIPHHRQRIRHADHHQADPVQIGGSMAMAHPWQDDFQRLVQSGRTSASPTTQRLSFSGQAQGYAPWQRPALSTMSSQILAPRQSPFSPHGMQHASYQTAPHLHTTSPPQSYNEPHDPLSHIRPSTAPPQTTSEPLTDGQEILSRTAESFVNDLNAESSVLISNPKLAESKFMQLIQGLGERKIVATETALPVNGGEEVGLGAQFVRREGKTGADWATDFMDQAGRAAQESTGSMSDQVDYGLAQHSSLYDNGQSQTVPMFTSSRINGPIQHGFLHQTNEASTKEQSAWDRQFSDQEAVLMNDRNGTTASQRRKSVHFDPSLDQRPLGDGVPSSLDEALASSTSVPGANLDWQESGLDEEFDQDAFFAFNGQMRSAQSPRLGIGAMESWGDLQRDWDTFQQSEPGVSDLKGMKRGDQVERYLFQAGNPYSAGVVDADRFGTESPTVKGVLELEAEVQADPTNHEAWFALGLKQQENEREDQAILALSKVVQLEPNHRAACLALAVSYTNESEREAANTMLEKWIELGEQVHGNLDGGRGDVLDSSMESRRDRLVERLIDIARETPDVVDADVQIALGVLFNSSEDYKKAEDCFLAALSVRPEDWLLYNRLGATLANSGRSQEAVQHYHKALSIHPNFVRALFNLGISYINLSEYSTAAQKILEALRLQQADATEGYMHLSTGGAGTRAKGVTSDTLWTSLRNACLHMGRQDLLALAAKKDLSGFPLDLDGEQSSQVSS